LLWGRVGETDGGVFFLGSVATIRPRILIQGCDRRVGNNPQRSEKTPDAPAGADPLAGRLPCWVGTSTISRAQVTAQHLDEHHWQPIGPWQPRESQGTEDPVGVPRRLPIDRQTAHVNALAAGFGDCLPRVFDPIGALVNVVRLAI
jgi:hypothetical protein